MRKPFLAALAVILALALMVPLAASAAVEPACEPPQNGTTLTATKTATGFSEKTITHDWIIEKTVTPEQIEIAQGKTGSVTYTITVTRSAVSETSTVTGVRGQICVTNGGAVATENLKLVDKVQYKTPGMSHFANLTGATQTIIPAQQLAPGETKCYDYEINFTPISNAQYRNTVKVTITNHSGHIGSEWGPEPKVDFGLPTSTSVTEIDEAAHVVDIETCPAGFTCVHNGPTEWDFADSGSVQFTKDITNDSVEGCAEATLPNTVTLTENDTLQQRTDDATVEIDIPCCECEETSLALSSNPSAAKVGETVTLTALLQDENGAAIVGHEVEFWDVTGPGEQLLGTGTTDSDGKASLQVTEDEAITATYEARVLFNGEQCDPAETTVVWTTGGGSIPGITGWGIIAMIGAIITAALALLRRKALA